MSEKIKVFHFHNGSGGGVLSVIKNLLLYSNTDRFENNVIYTINKDKTSHYEPARLDNAFSQKVFYYSSHWNLLYTCKQLARLLPGENALLVAHDWLELAMVSNLGLQNKLIQVVHGDYTYYYDLAKDNEASIDAYIAVSGSIKEKLQSFLPGKKEAVNYLRFPIPENNCSNENRDNNITFVGRCTEDKGYHLLPVIAKLVQDKGVNISWHIAGEITGEVKQKYPWPVNTDVQFYGLVPNGEINKMLCKMRYFILPSVAEGMPVSLIEAMKAGVVPIVNNLKGGITELVKDGETGFIADGNLPEAYAGIISMLDKDTQLQKNIARNCKELSATSFDPFENVKQYEQLFDSIYSKAKKQKQVKKIYRYRLDNTIYPNSLVAFIRKTKSLFNKK